MNHSSMTLWILLCTTIFFAIISLLFLLSKTKKKKLIVKALENNKAILDSQYASDEAQLKEALGAPLTEKLNSKITDIIALEKKSYKNLSYLFIDYQPAAIEMLPMTVGKIISAYIQCIKEAITIDKELAASKEEAVAVAEKSKEVDEADVDDVFQYEALIEQLRFEKQDFADKFKASQALLKAIYTKYKDSIDVDKVETLDKLKIPEIAAIFKVEI